MKDDGELRVGYARVEITPEVGGPLADAPLDSIVTGRGRFSSRLRDRLYARALHLARGDVGVTLVVGDLLLITEALHRAVAERGLVDVERLMLAATHTHSGPGGYWKAGRAERIVGKYEPAIFERLASGLAEAAVKAREGLARAEVRTAAVDVAGASANRRQKHGPVDRALSLLRFDVEGEAPIDVVSFSAHPVIGSERENGTISADFPGEVCRRLVERGARPIFFQGAVGGLSPLFPEFPMRLDEHLELVGDVLERGYERAVGELRAGPSGPLEVKRFGVPLGGVRCEVLPGAGVFEASLVPLRKFLERVGEDGREGGRAWMHWLRVGDAGLLGAPGDLGVSVALAMKRVLADRGVRLPVIGSQCGGYVGYVHLPQDYAHPPEPGFREMAYYENAMSLAGRELGTEMVDAVARVVDAVARVVGAPLPDAG